MELLYAAWPQAKVAALMEFNALGPHLADVEFCAIYSTAESDEHLPSAPGTTGRDASATIPGQEYGVVADNRGHVAALLKPAAAEADDTMIVTIREMAARSDCRGRGLGTMMLGHVRRVTNEMLGRVPETTLSFCAPEHARRYRRAGFSVYAPGMCVPVFRPSFACLQTQPTRTSSPETGSGWVSTGTDDHDHPAIDLQELIDRVATRSMHSVQAPATERPTRIRR